MFLDLKKWPKGTYDLSCIVLLSDFRKPIHEKQLHYDFILANIIGDQMVSSLYILVLKFKTLKKKN